MTHNAPIGSGVYKLPIQSDTALVNAIQAGEDEARTVLFDRYAEDVERVLYRVLGPDPEIADLLQDVFVVALSSIDKLRRPQALRFWLTGIAIRKARKCIKRRQRWRFIQFYSPSELPDYEAPHPSAEVSEAYRSTYSVLQQMKADERIVFALRHIEGMELTAIANACDISLSTVKRRLLRARKNFTIFAQEYPALWDWIEPVEVKL